ncbi:MAG: FAD-dependent oxidoreductase, partial [Planctomycetaceae bacterium]|nr:FAD-dependent oxidoreductase [Planctomycetaceae bacterium]
LTNETLFSLTELPRRLGIIGAGPIGAEMAQTFARLGSEVFLFDRSGNLLPRDDPEAGSILKEVFYQEGIRLHLRFQEMQIRQSEQDTIVVRGNSDGQAQEIEVDQLLVAVGRAPNVEGLNLEAVGVRYDQNGIQVNNALQTTNSRIFAAGDVCSKFKFTHAADFQARIVIQNALFALGPLGKKSTRNLLIPWATYTSPEVAQVGITAEQAQQQGIAIDTYIQKMSQVDRAILDDQTCGFVKVHTKKGSDQILGATIVAEHAGDLISELTLAMQTSVGLSRMASIIHPYPTQADAIRKLGDQFNRTRLTPLNRWILNTLKRINVGK